MKQCSNGAKQNLILAYDLYCQHLGIQWVKPFYKRYDRQPKIPLEEKMDMITAKSGKGMALFLRMMKDLGTRPIELTWLKVKDIDLENGIVNITTAKFGIARTLKLSSQTLAMLKTYINRRKLGLNDRIFPTKSDTVAKNYRRTRNLLAEKLQDITIKTIRLYDFRHWKASMTYHKTKDLLYTQKFLGHRDLRSTLRYIQLVDFGKEEYSSSIAKNVNEAQKLIESGFEYVTTFDNLMLFRKRK